MDKIWLCVFKVLKYIKLRYSRFFVAEQAGMRLTCTEALRHFYMHILFLHCTFRPNISKHGQHVISRYSTWTVLDVRKTFLSHKASENDHEIPQSHTADKPTAPCGRATEYQQPQCTRNAIKVKKPALLSPIKVITTQERHKVRNNKTRTRHRTYTHNVSNNKQ